MSTVLVPKIMRTGLRVKVASSLALQDGGPSSPTPGSHNGVQEAWLLQFRD
jgi:hypothetical protein